MKLFWKYLPFSLPLLALVLMLTACGKGDKVTGNIFKRTKEDVTKATLGQRANGARSAAALDPEEFRRRCPKDFGGLIEPGPICAISVKKLKLDTNGAAQQAIVDLKAGELVISAVSAGTISQGAVDIRLDGVHFMNIGDRKMSDRDGQLSFALLGDVSAVAGASVWKCLDANLNPAGCPEDILNH